MNEEQPIPLPPGVTLKPPPPPPLPPAVPPDFLIVSENDPDVFQARVQQVVAAGMIAQSTAQVTNIAGSNVLFTQAFVRNPRGNKRRRTRESTQAIIDLQTE